MLQQLTKRLFSPLYLGIDWQAECLRIVLLPAVPMGVKPSQPLTCLGQWMVPLPKTDALNPAALAGDDEWRLCAAQVAALVGKRRLWVNVGLPNDYFTWLHWPARLSANPKLRFQSNSPSAPTLIKRQLEYQRRAAEKLGLDASSLLVEHLQLAPALDFLLVLNKHHEHQVRKRLSSLQIDLNKPLKGNLEALVFSHVRCPYGIDSSYAMAWWLAQKYRHKP